MFRHHHALLAAAILALSLAGCDDSPTSSNSGSWIDPRIAPRVVATYPLDGTTGPFELYVPGSSLTPHFIVQMNKAINRFAFDSNWFAVEGFDRPVRAFLLQIFERDPEQRRATAADPLVGVLALAVYDSLGYGSMRYRIGHSYTVTVQTTLEDATGRHPVQPYRFSFEPEPYFRVTTVSPTDGDELVHPSSNLFVRFNSVVNTTIIASLQLTPSSQGHWTQVPYDSTGISFAHSEPLAFGTQYTITVGSTAADVEGNTLQGNCVSRFRTLPFQVVSNAPLNGQTGVSPGTSIQVELSGPLDPSSFESAFSIEPLVGGFLRLESSRIVLEPVRPLALETRYTVRISTALRATDGTPLSAPHTFSFTTDRLRVLYTNPYDGAFDVQRSSVISVQCNTLVDIVSAAAAFSITPAVAGIIELGPQGYGFSFRPNTLLASNAIYTVTISTALRSSSGTFLAAPHQFTFRTGGL